LDSCNFPTSNAFGSGKKETVGEEIRFDFQETKENKEREILRGLA
jgi:hypothetical protein